MHLLLLYSLVGCGLGVLVECGLRVWVGCGLGVWAGCGLGVWTGCGLGVWTGCGLGVRVGCGFGVLYQWSLSGRYFAPGRGHQYPRVHTSFVRRTRVHSILLLYSSVDDTPVRIGSSLPCLSILVAMNTRLAEMFLAAGGRRTASTVLEEPTIVVPQTSVAMWHTQCGLM